MAESEEHNVLGVLPVYVVLGHHLEQANNSGVQRDQLLVRMQTHIKATNASRLIRVEIIIWLIKMDKLVCANPWVCSHPVSVDARAHMDFRTCQLDMADPSGHCDCCKLRVSVASRDGQ